jgi:hypothetical protein
LAAIPERAGRDRYSYAHSLVAEILYYSGAMTGSDRAGP